MPSCLWWVTLGSWSTHPIHSFIYLFPSNPTISLPFDVQLMQSCLWWVTLGSWSTHRIHSSISLFPSNPTISLPFDVQLMQSCLWWVTPSGRSEKYGGRKRKAASQVDHPSRFYSTAFPSTVLLLSFTILPIWVSNRRLPCTYVLNIR